MPVPPPAGPPGGSARGAWVAGALLALAGTAAGATPVINPNGEGLTVWVAGNTQLQIQRAGRGQVYDPGTRPPSASLYNSVILAHGPDVYAASCNPCDTAANHRFQAVRQTPVQGAGTAADPFRVETTVAAGPISVAQTLRYTAPDHYFVVEIEVSAPPGNTRPVKLYHLVDTYLAGDDNGPAYVDATPPKVVGVSRRVGGDPTYEAFIQLDAPWDHYYSGLYSDAFRLVSGGRDLDDRLDRSASTDNGIGVQWNLGMLTGTRRVRYAVSFTDHAFAELDVNGDGVLDLLDGDQDGTPDYLAGGETMAPVPAPPPEPLVVQVPARLDFGRVHAGAPTQDTCRDLDLSGSTGLAGQHLELSVAGLASCRGEPVLLAGGRTRSLGAPVVVAGVEPADPRLTLCLAAPRCAGEVVSDGVRLRVRPADPAGSAAAREVELVWEVVGRPWWRCHLVWMLPTAAGATLLFLILGVVRPARFPASAAIRLAGRERDLKRVPAVLLRDCPGAGSGFYRSARLGLSLAGDLRG